MADTLTFDERVQGWTSFHSFIPEMMVGISNKFLTFRGGELYQHHSENDSRNTYYGETFPTRVSVMINDAPSEIKFLKAVSTEGNTSWDTTLTGYVSSIEDFTRSTVKPEEYIEQEGIRYAHVRRNELATDLSSKSNYGIGVAEFITSTTLIFLFPLPFSLSVGDTLLNDREQAVGIVASVSGMVITLTSTPENISNGDFVIGRKNSRIEGGEVRGYTFRADLQNFSTSKSEIFAVNAEVAKSYT